MARIAGVDIPDNKRVIISLTYIYGIGPNISKEILSKAGIDESVRVKDLDEEQLANIRSAIDSLEVPVEGELRRIVNQNIRRLKDIRSYRGLRHVRGLPTRGQQTRSNARTRKGKKKTVGGMKKKLTKK